MTVGMKQDTVIKFIGAAIDTPVYVMVVPSGSTGDELFAERTKPSFSIPEVLEPRFFPEVDMDMAEQPFFEIKFPLGVKRIGIAANLAMPLNGKPSSKKEPIGNPFAFVIDREGVEAVIRKRGVHHVLLTNPFV